MKRREFSKAWTAGLALPAWSLSHNAAAQAKPPKAGADYQTLDKPAPTEAAAGKIEVVEFFWYACPHCNAFEPRLEEWVKKLPPDVAFRRAPVSFRSDFVPLQKLYYALESLDLVDALHAKAFYAIHVEKQRLNSDETVLAWIGKQPGIDKAKFDAAYKSFGVATKVRKATQLQEAYKVEGVPSLGIAGRFYTDGTMAQSMERALQVTEFLIAEQRKPKG